MTRALWTVGLLVAVLLSDGTLTNAYVEYKNWAFHFPYGSNMGLYMALALPIDVPSNENVFVAYNFEANYLLPNNVSETVQFPPLAEADSETEGRGRRRLDRATLYAAIERKMDAYGYAGRRCLLKAICEAAGSTLEHNGIVGDIVHIVLTPSATDERNDLLAPVYKHAERIGRDHQDCHKFAEHCPTSFLNLITWLKY